MGTDFKIPDLKIESRLQGPNYKKVSRTIRSVFKKMVGDYKICF